MHFRYRSVSIRANRHEFNASKNGQRWEWMCSDAVSVYRSLLSIWYVYPSFSSVAGKVFHTAQHDVFWHDHGVFLTRCCNSPLQMLNFSCAFIKGACCTEPLSNMYSLSKTAQKISYRFMDLQISPITRYWWWPVQCRQRVWGTCLWANTLLHCSPNSLYWLHRNMSQAIM